MFEVFFSKFYRLLRKDTDTSRFTVAKFFQGHIRTSFSSLRALRTLWYRVLGFRFSQSFIGILFFMFFQGPARVSVGFQVPVLRFCLRPCVPLFQLLKGPARVPLWSRSQFSGFSRILGKAFPVCPEQFGFLKIRHLFYHSITKFNFPFEQVCSNSKLSFDAVNRGF